MADEEFPLPKRTASQLVADADEDDELPQLFRSSTAEPVRVAKSRRGTVGIEDIQTWQQFAEAKHPYDEAAVAAISASYRVSVEPFNAELNSKISIWRGDSCVLAVDAIVNAANSSLLGGGGIDGAIHCAAGHSLYEECRKLNGCKTGFTKITGGHRLPCKHILHTVGPIGENPSALRSCYETCMQVSLENSVRSVAFCCISTGIFGYPGRAAAKIALDTVRKFLLAHPNDFDRVIFVLFMESDWKIYNELTQVVFPIADPSTKSASEAVAAAADTEEQDAQ